MSHLNYNSSNLSCLNFTIQTAKDVFYIKISLGSFTVLANLIAIALIFFSRRFKEFTFRLVIYLLATDVLQAIAIVLEVIPVEVRNASTPATIKNSTAWLDFCNATGFFGMVTLWMGNIVIIWIVIYLVVLGRRLYYRKQGEKKQINSLKREAIGVAALFIVPVIIGVIPFTINGDMYGLSGLWCWIKIVKTHPRHCGELHFASLKVVLIFYYGPLMLIVLFAVVCMMITIGLVCCGAAKRAAGKQKTKFNTDKQQGYLKDIMLVLAYPILYCAVCLLLLANRVTSSVHFNWAPIEGMWITHAVADPVRLLLPAIAFLFHPYVWKPHKSQDGQQMEQNHETTRLKDDDRAQIIDPSLNNGAKTTYGTCDDDNSNKVLSSVVVDHHQTY